MTHSQPSKPLMQFLRPITNRVINPITRRVAGILPGFAIVHTVGRRSGRQYAIPMNVFRHGTDYILALTYGSDVQWVRNVLAAGGCVLETHGRRVAVTEPEVFVDPDRRLMPFPVQFFLGLLRVSEFMRLRLARGA